MTKIQNKRSNVLDSGKAKAPTSAQTEYGELCVNYSGSDPSLFIKGDDDKIYKICGSDSEAYPGYPDLGGGETLDDRYVKITGSSTAQTITGTGGLILEGDITLDSVKSATFLGTDVDGKIVSVSESSLIGDAHLRIKTYGEEIQSTDFFTANQSTDGSITLPQIRYQDLSGTPSIPTVNDSTITIKQPGLPAEGLSFTVNQSGDTTIELLNDNTVVTPGSGSLTIKTSGEGAEASGTFDANQSGDSTLILPTIRYEDLSGTPAIPGVGSGTITIKQPGLDAAGISFNVNQSGDTEINLRNDNTVPTVGDGTITIKQVGKAAQTFSVNQTGNTTINLDNGPASVNPGDGALTIKTYGEKLAATNTFSANQSVDGTITLPQIRYQDISGQPTIPTVGAGTITIKQPGLPAAGVSFDVNQTGNTEINLLNDDTIVTPGDGALTIKSYGSLDAATGTYTADQSSGSIVVLPQINYSDLAGIPTIPGVGDGSLTIVTSGENAAATGTYTANQGSDSTLSLPAIRWVDLTGTPDIWTDADSIAVGTGGLSPTATGINNVSLGVDSLAATTSGTANVAVGRRALTSNTLGSNNTALGHEALKNCTDGDGNTAVGRSAMLNNTSGQSNTAVGLSALSENTIGEFNTSIGHLSLSTNVSGSNNTALGAGVLANNVSGSGNTGVGQGCLNDVTGSNNTAVGALAMASTTSGHSNVAIGDNALQSNITGIQNTALGFNALEKNTVDNNTAVGNQCLAVNTTGDGNTGLGSNVLETNLTGQNNTAVGLSALKANSTGSNNTAIGISALLINTVESGNTCVGAEGMQNLISGNSNTGIGQNVLSSLTSGDFNSAIGRNSGRYKIDGTNNTNLSNCTTLGYDSRVSGSDQVQLGGSGTTTYAYGAVQNRSDQRDKTDIRDTILGLDFLNSLRPVDFRWNYREDYFDTEEYQETETYTENALNPAYVPEFIQQETLDEATGLYSITDIVNPDYTGEPRFIEQQFNRTVTKERLVSAAQDGSRARVRYHHGLIAQEVKTAMDAQGVDFAGYQDHTVYGGLDVLSIGYTELIGPLIKAVQELSTEVESLKSRLDAGGL